MSTTERRHTPGPWWAVDNSWETSSVYADDGETLIAKVPIDSSVDEYTQDKFEQVKEYNAHLISAAPELLDLLLTAGDADSSDDDVRTSWWEARAAAIAKAEGRA